MYVPTRVELRMRVGIVHLTLLARLTDVEGSPLPSKTISFMYSYDGRTYNVIGHADTDWNGVAWITHIADRPTHYLALFAGDEDYEGAYATAFWTMPVVVRPFRVLAKAVYTRLTRR